jgi:crossover junction endodeoxyribonuclease RuvC
LAIPAEQKVPKLLNSKSLTRRSKLIVLGIDAGIANTGYGLIEADGRTLQLLDFGNIKTAGNTDSAHRLKFIYDELIRLVEQYQPDYIAIEDIFFSKNVSSAFAVGEARGIAKLAAANTERDIFSYTPAELKQAVVGYGKATKRQVQKMVQVLLKLDDIPQPDHAADALALAICHARSHKILRLREKLERKTQ